MKLRSGFVSNSSSTSFYIHNKTYEPLHLIEFVRENIGLVDKYNSAYGYCAQYTHEEVLHAATLSMYDLTLAPGGDNVVTFGDEQGNPLGTVMDYMLRNGGKSTRFGWSYCESLR